MARARHSKPRNERTESHGDPMDAMDALQMDDEAKLVILPP